MIVKQNTIDLQFYSYLQVLDALTTLIGLHMGASEASPFIKWLMQFGWTPAAGVFACKLVALGLAAFCLWAGRRHLIHWITYWFAGLVIWNLGILLVLTIH